MPDTKDGQDISMENILDNREIRMLVVWVGGLGSWQCITRTELFNQAQMTTMMDTMSLFTDFA